MICDTEDNLQIAAYKLNQIITEHGLTVSVQKTKLMAFKGGDPVRSKIVIDNSIVEQVNSFNFLVYLIFYRTEVDIDNKLSIYLKITGIMNNMFRPQKTLKKTRLKLYSTLALTHLLYSCQIWAIKAGDTRKITAAEMKYMRKVAGYVWADNKQTNTEIAEELNITPVWTKYVNTVESGCSMYL
jgi:hypothetical protein